MLDIAAVDTTLSQNGNFNLLDWCLTNSVINYQDYEQWRCGNLSYLCDSLLSTNELSLLSASAGNVCKKLKLIGEVETYSQWDGKQQKNLKFHRDSTIHEAFATRWARAQDAPQLDLFMDNSGVVAENKLCDALANRQFDKAENYINELALINPQNTKLGGYSDLLAYGHHMNAVDLITEDDISDELDGLEKEVLPIAQSLLGKGARDYLALAWQRLAKNLSLVAYDPSLTKLHASYAFAQIPDWYSVSKALFEKPETYQYCELTVRLAEAFEALGDRHKSIYCWSLAFDKFSSSAEEALEANKPLLYHWWETFSDASEVWPASFFAGYLLVKQPEAYTQHTFFPDFSQQSTNLVTRLISAKLNNYDQVSARQSIQEHSSALLRMVMEER